MINIKNISKDKPYTIFAKKYEESLKANESMIEAISIASFSHEYNQVNSRYVNLKFIKNKEFIFFTNYDSPKSQEFYSHNQITALIFWKSTNTQIRIKANIKKIEKDFNKKYFSKRDYKKNAIAISSLQSSEIESYDQVIQNYRNSLELDDLKKCPSYWGGYSFTPFYFEFWEGHSSRLNRREAYSLNGGRWIKSFLQP